MSARLAMDVSTIDETGCLCDEITTEGDALCFELWETRALAAILKRALDTAETYEYAAINRLLDALEAV